MTDRFGCVARDGSIQNHSKISLDRIRGHGDRDGGHCAYCGKYVRKVVGDYRWAATTLILEWP